MTKINKKLIEKFAELSPVLNESDASTNPQKVVETALSDGIAVLSNSDMNEQTAIEAEQERLSNKTSGEKPERFVELSDDDDKDKSAKEIQESLKRRIFDN